ncbi:hypothetical protein H4219_004796 [Mycoemilia scoparia]|uniref:Uncharacterized protein n=1 Tax=Mycoemilia scoparia TaxID=417184 RepID=A0A9W7ZX37_9FUNG|nr:hypothetical protein H4219_004796 [Mycoemilia scoparia]
MKLSLNNILLFGAAAILVAVTTIQGEVISTTEPIVPTGTPVPTATKTTPTSVYTHTATSTSSPDSCSSLNTYGYKLIYKKYGGIFRKTTEFSDYAKKALDVFLRNPSQLTQEYIDDNSPSFVSSMEFYTCKFSSSADTKSQASACIGKFGRISSDMRKFQYVGVAFNSRGGVVMAAKCNSGCPNGSSLSGC